ncbi:MAG: TlpA family protein disulfide reductase [Verrucomicrobia bacterium]|nr:TlpA family protein disulfide reductase [Verrucomicrobiota bacterium]
MSYPTRLLGGLALGLILPLCAPAQLKVGQPFPDLAAFGLEGRLPACAGQVVLVDFWATWCAPCKASFPAYGELQRELAPRGFVLLAVSVDKTAAPYDEFLGRYRPPFATVRDGAQRLIAQVRVPAMPTSYLLDRHGVVRVIHSGYHGEATMRALREEIVRLLEEKP